MSRYENKQETTREDFADGSALITYPDGSMLIVEGKLSKVSTLREGRAVNYDDPPPPPAEGAKLPRG